MPISLRFYSRRDSATELLSPAKRKLVILGVATVVIAVALYVFARHLDLRARMDQVVATIRESGPLPFFTAMALLPAVGFPLSGFTLVAGPVFGPTMGVPAVVLCAVAAIACNVAFSYWLASRAMRPAAQWVVRRMGYGLPEVRPQAAWLTIMVMRTVPMPFSLQSLLLGLARVPFGPYMLVSIVVPSVFTFAAITLTDGLMRGDRWAIAGAAALFLAVGTVLHFLRKRLQLADTIAPVVPGAP